MSRSSGVMVVDTLGWFENKYIFYDIWKNLMVYRNIQRHDFSLMFSMNYDVRNYIFQCWMRSWKNWYPVIIYIDGLEYTLSLTDTKTTKQPSDVEYDVSYVLCICVCDDFSFGLSVTNWSVVEYIFQFFILFFFFIQDYDGVVPKTWNVIQKGWTRCQKSVSCDRLVSYLFIFSSYSFLVFLFLSIHDLESTNVFVFLTFFWTLFFV